MTLGAYAGLAQDLWAWMTLAVVLLILELFTGTLVLLGMAAGAMVAGLVLRAVPDTRWEVLLLVFSALTIFVPLFGNRTLFLGRRPLETRRFRHLGKVVVLKDPITGGEGVITLDDCRWKCEGPDLPAGEKVVVVAVENGRLIVAAVPPDTE